MNAERVVALAVALACIVAMGVSATTLESSLSSDPDEVIDLDYENIPFGNEQARTIKEEVQSNEENPEREVRESQPENQQEQPQQQESENSEGPGDEQSLLDRLLDLLRALLPYLLALLALVLGVAAARRYGPRLVALLLAVFPQRRGDDDGAGVEWVADPRNEIERAWLAMTDRAGIERPRQMTTAECASAAIAAGLDPDGVNTLRSVFENVRYGTGPVTDEDARRARESLRRMDLGGEL